MNHYTAAYHGNLRRSAREVVGVLLALVAGAAAPPTNLKAWWGLVLPERPGRWQSKHAAEKRWVLGVEFKAFVNAFVRLPCQIIRTGRKLVYRLLGWNRYLPIFFRLLDVLRC